MPRQARIDSPGALHHIIVRGIYRRTIFDDDQDRFDFLKNLGSIPQQAEAACYGVPQFSSLDLIQNCI
ncbi:MAG: hypothetical protein ACQES8_05645 [Thermodesulfobacteriota bacterium]